MTRSGRARAFEIGTRVRDKWRIDAVLGEGGMATVYGATHRNGSRVALKVLHPDLALDDATCERFRREGYLANQVDHPGVVRVLDDDVTADGRVFLVMERLTGRSVKDRWLAARRRLPAAEALDIVAGTLDVLMVAHARGIVHRDIKPDNLFLEDDGRLRLLDFGIARLREPASTGTASGALLGTPAFMAPEQALARWDEVDARTDLFALGATFWTLVTGTLVHRGMTQNELLVSAATRPVPPFGSVCIDATPEVGELVDRALAFDRAARWPDAVAMRAAADRARGSFRDETIRLAPPVEGIDQAATLYPAASTPARAPEPGTEPSRVGRFEIGERLSLGDGSMFRARDTALHREVAVKLLASGTDDRAGADRERLLREARAAAALRHPNVLEVLEVGESAGEAYVALELVAGQTMAQLLPVASQFPLSRRLRWLTELASALEAAKARGVPHASIRPQDVVVSDTGTIKITGLGSGDASPDPRASERSWGELAAQLLGERGSWVGTGVPPELVRMIERARGSEGADPLDGFLPIIEALASALTTTPEEGTPSKKRSSSAWALGAVALVGAALGTVAWWRLSRIDPPSTPVASAVVPTAVVETTPSASATPAPAPTSEPSASSVERRSQPIRTDCLCFPPDERALCKRVDHVECVCRDAEGFIVSPPSGDRFSFPPDALPATYEGQTCVGVSRYTRDGVPGERPGQGRAEACQTTCSTFENHAGATGGYCTGFDAGGRKRNGRLKCPRPE